MIYFWLRQWFAFVCHDVCRQQILFFSFATAHVSSISMNSRKLAWNGLSSKLWLRQYRHMAEIFKESISFLSINYRHLPIFSLLPQMWFIILLVFSKHHQESLRKKNSMKKFNTFRLCQLIQRNEYNPIPLISIK